MLRKQTALTVLLLAAALFVSGCGEDPAPVVEQVTETQEPVTGDVDLVIAEATDDMLAIMSDMPQAAPGQWITFKSDQAEGELSIAILRSEDFQGVSCLWYQISFDEGVFQVLVDQGAFDAAKDDMREFIQEMGSDPIAWIQANLVDGDPSDVFMPDNDPARMMTLIRGIKMIRIGSDGQIIAVDMNGVPELLESMLAQNPDFFSETGAGITVDSETDFQDFTDSVQEAEFHLEFIQMPVADATLGCLTLSASHPEVGSMNLAFSSELPIIPLAEASLVLNDPDQQGGRVFVSGFGFDGAEDLLPGPADMTFPAAMMLQGFMQ